MDAKADFESSLGAHVRRYVFAHCGSYIIDIAET